MGLFGLIRRCHFRQMKRQECQLSLSIQIWAGGNLTQFLATEMLRESFKQQRIKAFSLDKTGKFLLCFLNIEIITLISLLKTWHSWLWSIKNGKELCTLNPKKIIKVRINDSNQS